MTSQIFDKFRFFVLVMISGVAAGLAAIFFRYLISLIHNLLFYQLLTFESADMLYVEPSIWGFGVIFIPVAGAFVVTFLIKTFAPEVKGSGVPEVMNATHFKQGRIRPIVSVVKSIAAAITIGSGGSAGREGPIIQIGATVGSTLGQWIKVRDWQRITLVACGAGGGIAATFNTPIAGILFAVEIILVELSARTVIPVCLATAIATYVSYFAFSSGPFFGIPSSFFANVGISDIGLSVVLSCLLGLIAYIFIQLIYCVEDGLGKITKNDYLKHALGMLGVGLSLYMMLFFTGHYFIGGVGYATVLNALKGLIMNPGFLLTLVLMKIFVTSLTLGSGGSGGVFSPLLFIGAAFGACFALLCNHYVFAAEVINLQFAVLAGMAGLVGATTAAPLTAIMMTTELIHDYKIILPLVLVVVISCFVRRLFTYDSVYSMKLRRRGINIKAKLLSVDQLKNK